MGATSSALWGAAATGIAGSRLQGLRAQAAAAAGRLPRGAFLGLRLHCHSAGCKLDPLVINSMDVIWMWAVT
eukprot:4911462-Pyramimonas_sp.AAC.1